MFNNVIAGVDGFDGGRDAIALAQAVGAGRLTLVGVHPHDPFRTRGSVAGYETLLHDDTLRALEAARLQAQCDAELVVMGDNSPARGLQQAAEDLGADLLVVGAAHHGPVGRLMLGDVGRSALPHAPCPVAVAPRRCAPTAPHTVGVGYDGTPEAQAALELAADWAQEHGAALTVWVAWQTPAVPNAAMLPGDLEQMRADAAHRADELLAAALAEVASTVAGHVVAGRAVPVLKHASESLDLLVVGSRGWGPLARVAVGSTSDRLMHHAACAVVVVPRPAHVGAAEPASIAAQAPAG